MKISTAIITAAGFGSRFLPFVKNIPKEMVPIIDKPSIQLLVEECLEAGIEKIIIVVRKGNNLISDYFSLPASDVQKLLTMQGKIERYDSVEKVLNMKGIQIIFQEEDLPYGNGSPVYSAKPYLKHDEPFVLLFGDDMFISESGNGAVKQMIEFFQRKNGEVDGVLAGCELPKEEIANKYASVKFKFYDEGLKEGVMDFQIEKPSLDQVQSNIMTYGRMVLTYKIFDYLKADSIGKDDELWIQDAVANLAKNGVVMVKIPTGKWITTGDPAQYFKAVVEYYIADKKYGAGAKDYLRQLSLD